MMLNSTFSEYQHYQLIDFDASFHDDFEQQLYDLKQSFSIFIQYHSYESSNRRQHQQVLDLLNTADSRLTFGALVKSGEHLHQFLIELWQYQFNFFITWIDTYETLDILNQYYALFNLITEALSKTFHTSNGLCAMLPIQYLLLRLLNEYSDEFYHAVGLHLQPVKMEVLELILVALINHEVIDELEALIANEKNKLMKLTDSVDDFFWDSLNKIEPQLYIQPQDWHKIFKYNQLKLRFNGEEI